MAYSIVPPLATIICKKPCAHTDCKHWAAFIKTGCAGCGKMFKPGDSWTDYDGHERGVHKPWHFACADKHADAERAQAGA